METLFISDLHLDAARPAKVSLFSELLRAAPARARNLYILGDLFEAWAGDDDLREPHGHILEALAQATQSGLSIGFMRGNRDLLVGETFARRTGCRLLPDPTVLQLDNQRVLLTHGDLLCTSDRGYQAYRRIATLRPLQAAFLTLPLKLRQRTTAGMRKGMHRPGRIIDADPSPSKTPCASINPIPSSTATLTSTAAIPSSSTATPPPATYWATGIKRTACSNGAQATPASAVCASGSTPEDITGRPAPGGCANPRTAACKRATTIKPRQGERPSAR